MTAKKSTARKPSSTDMPPKRLGRVSANNMRGGTRGPEGSTDQKVNVYGRRGRPAGDEPLRQKQGSKRR